MATPQFVDLDEVTDYGLFVDGTIRASDREDRIRVSYPYEGTVWASAPSGTPRDVEAGAATAKAAFQDGWGDRLPSERSAVLHEIAAVIEAHTDELAELETLQNGRLLADHVHQVDAMAGFFRYYAGYCDKVTGEVYPVENKDGEIFNFTSHEPYGVVGLVTTWNAPLFMTTRKLAPALAAGNAVVHKPSEHAPVSAVRFAELLFRETNLPAGAYNVIPGPDRTGVALTEQSDVDKISVTGSTAVGRAVLRNAAEQITPVTAQLGANNPTIVFPNADLENAVTGAVKGIFTGSGQGCTAGARVLVDERIHDEFVERFVERSRSITLGDPMDPETEMGPVAYRDHFRDVTDYIDSAIEEGATLALGPEDTDVPGDLFVPPTIFTDVDMTMRVAREEVFGPVGTVHSFSGEDEAVSIANDTEYGLTASVWTEDLRRAHRVAERLDAGTVFVNEGRHISYGTPFGGYKQSGIGREHGESGIEDYLQVKSVWIDLSGEVSDPFTVGTQ